MPIHCQIPIRDLSQKEFDAIDRSVMGHAFASQNELGRLCDELIYENDVALRLKEAGHDVETQVRVTVSHKSFEKVYRLDLVCDHAVYDGKTVSAFTGEHDAQVLNYAMLLDIRHIKLLNFRNPKVQGRLRYNAITTEKRHQVEFNTSQWRAQTESCDELCLLTKDLVRDWGGFLSAQLYQEALVHFCGGREQCETRIPMSRGEHKLGTHRVAQHAPDAFFVVTGLTKDTHHYHQHLERLLRLTTMQVIQWININHHKVEFVTIEK